MLATDDNGCQVWSDPLEILNVGLLAASQQQTFEVFPNPTNSVLFLRLGHGDTRALNYQLRNALGQQILMGRMVEGSTTQLDLGPLAQGVYLLQTTTPEGAVQVYRIVRQ